MTPDRARAAGVNRAIVALCRDHGQTPAWWGGLPREERAILLAELSTRPQG